MKTFRKYLFRVVFFLLGESKLYHRMVVDRPLFPQRTNPHALLKLLMEAKQHVPYYREHLPKVPKFGRSFFSDYEKLDFRLEKSVLKQDLSQVLNPRVFDVRNVVDYRQNFFRGALKILKKNSFIPLNTGGSSGNPLHFCRSRSSGLRFLLQFLSIARYTGWKEGEGYMSCFQEGMYSQFRVLDPLLRVLGVPLFLFQHVDEVTARRFAKTFNSSGPTILMGFPSYLTELAYHVKKHTIDLRKSLKAIHCCGEMLFDDQRALLEKVFGAPVYNIYGSNEQGLTACECHRHDGLHVLEDNVYLENDDEGHLLVTILDSDYMPLIKYNTGDRGVIQHKKCACGVEGKMMVKLEGRVEEYLLDPDGKKVYASYLRQLLLDANERFENALLRSQFLQKGNGVLRFKVQLSRKEFGQTVVEHISQALQTDYRIVAKGEVVDDLFQEKGKFKFLLRE